MILKNELAALVLLFINVIFVDCISSENNGNGLFDIVKVNAIELQSPRYGEQDPAAKTVAGGANDFAFRLSAMLAENVDNDNFVCSPYSIWLPLSALVNATNIQNKAALLTTLGSAGITEEDINRAASQMLYDLTNIRAKEYGEYHNPLKIANAIFVGNDVTIKNNFAQIFMNYYRGSSINVDFSSPGAVNAVNRWASENTDGLITNLVQEFVPLTVAVIANAIYFSDKWSTEFNPERTEEQIFHAPSGETTVFYMLREGNSQTYYEDNRLQAMPLYFTSGGGMYIILPKICSAAELLSSMTNDYFNEIQVDSILAAGKLLLPRFSVESNITGLDKTLEMLGIPLFDKYSAPLTGGLIEEDTPVYLSDVVQKAVIHIDEKGTTAAAVTSMSAPALSILRPTDNFEMICDKPFVFILFDYTYDGGAQILFTGIVNKPQ
jgi:serpin B